MAKSSSWSFSKFYFAIVSIASIIGMVIAFGLALYQLILGAVVTEDEYINGRNSWEVQQCSDPYYLPRGRVVLEADVAAEPAGEEVIQKTPEEIAECEAEARERVLSQRSLDKKEAVTGGLIRGSLFALLFVTHYPKMIEGSGGAESKANSKKSKRPTGPKNSRKTTPSTTARKSRPKKRVIAKK